MTKEQYLKIVNEKIQNSNSKHIMINQINIFFNSLNFTLPPHNYKIGDNVYLKKGTLLHGTYKNLDGLKEIVKNGLISSWFIDGRLSKYPSSIGVWNLKQDYFLKDYIDFYSGGTIMYCGIFDNDRQNKTQVIPYSKMKNINVIANSINCHMWVLEQTKEARFMPSLAKNNVQIGIIFNGNNKYSKILLNGDILNPNIINDKDVKEFINPKYYEKFINDRKHKDDFFTDRESAIIFGIPSNFIEGILVGKNYEQNTKILEEIKQLLPNAYICNLDGKIIKC